MKKMPLPRLSSEFPVRLSGPFVVTWVIIFSTVLLGVYWEQSNGTYRSDEGLETLKTLNKVS